MVRDLKILGKVLRFIYRPRRCSSRADARQPVYRLHFMRPKLQQRLKRSLLDADYGIALVLVFFRWLRVVRSHCMTRSADASASTSPR